MGLGGGGRGQQSPHETCALVDPGRSWEGPGLLCVLLMTAAVSGCLTGQCVGIDAKN